MKIKMFEKIKKSKQIVKQVLSQRKYFYIFLLTAVFIFITSYILMVATVADKSLSIFIMMSGFLYTILQLFLLGVIAVLFGSFISLFVYRIQMVRKVSGKTGFFWTVGMTAGLFSAGCPTCGAVLFGLIGAPLALMYLPFEGLELKVLSIVLLFVSNYLMALSLEGCKIK